MASIQNLQNLLALQDDLQDLLDLYIKSQMPMPLELFQYTQAIVATMTQVSLSTSSRLPCLHPNPSTPFVMFPSSLARCSSEFTSSVPNWTF